MRLCSEESMTPEETATTAHARPDRAIRPLQPRCPASGAHRLCPPYSGRVQSTMALLLALNAAFQVDWVSELNIGPYIDLSPVYP